VSVVNSSARVSAFFDDLVLTQEPPLIVQENHYDAWGFNLVGIETQGQPNHRYQFNGMSEKTPEFGLNWYDTPFRSYDPQIGRFVKIDELAEKYFSASPYVFSLNNPIALSDPTGLDPYYNWTTKQYEDKDEDGNTINVGWVRWSNLGGQSTLLCFRVWTNLSESFSQIAKDFCNPRPNVCGQDCDTFRYSRISLLLHPRCS
jgi:RHS repeat-associated protein